MQACYQVITGVRALQHGSRQHTSSLDTSGAASSKRSPLASGLSCDGRNLRVMCGWFQSTILGCSTPATRLRSVLQRIDQSNSTPGRLELLGTHSNLKCVLKLGDCPLAALHWCCSVCQLQLSTAETTHQFSPVSTIACLAI